MIHTGAVAKLINKKIEEKVEKKEIEMHLQDFWDQVNGLKDQ